MITIGEVAARAGVSVDAVRYYEREGLLPEPARDSGGRRVYPEEILDALHLLTTLRGAGFGIGEVRAVMQLKELDSVTDRLHGVLAECERLSAALDIKARQIRAARKVVAQMRDEARAHLAAEG